MRTWMLMLVVIGLVLYIFATKTKVTARVPVIVELPEPSGPVTVKKFEPHKFVPSVDSSLLCEICGESEANKNHIKALSESVASEPMDFRQELLGLINGIRKDALHNDQRLNDAAQDHAHYLASLGRRANWGTNLHALNGGIGARARKYGFTGNLAENLAGSSTAAYAVEHWSDSPEHCASMVSGAYNAVGFGHAVGEAGHIWCAVFGNEQTQSAPQSPPIAQYTTVCGPNGCRYVPQQQYSSSYNYSQPTNYSQPSGFRPIRRILGR